MKSNVTNSIVWFFVGTVFIALGAMATYVVYTTYIHPSSGSISSTSENREQHESNTEPFILQPPAQSLKGTLIEQAGSVKHKTRDANAYVDASASATILIGESVATGDDGMASIRIPNLCTTKLGKNSEIAFLNLFAENSVFQQKSGNILYEIVSNKPVAIRALHTLIQSEESTFSVNIVDTDIAVIAEKGNIKIAIVDTDNVTHLYTLSEGKRANIDDTARTVTIVSPRKGK